MMVWKKRCYDAIFLWHDETEIKMEHILEYYQLYLLGPVIVNNF